MAHDYDCERDCNNLCCEPGYYSARSYLYAADMYKHSDAQIMHSLGTIKGLSPRVLETLLAERGVGLIETEGGW